MAINRVTPFVCLYEFFMNLLSELYEFLYPMSWRGKCIRSDKRRSTSVRIVPANDGAEFLPHYSYAFNPNDDQSQISLLDLSADLH